MIAFRLPCGRVTFLDDEDAHVLEGKNWHSDRRGRTYYVRGRVQGQTSGGVYLHNLLIGGRADHKDGDGLNNRRSNIRPCTQGQNGLNRAAKMGKKFKGVYSRGAKFYAQIYINGRSHTSHGHETAESAAHAYDRLAMELHGEFARLNFPNQGETVLRMLDHKDARQHELQLERDSDYESMP